MPASASYRTPDDASEASSTLTALHPWAGLFVSERVSVWAAAGYGSGELALERGTAAEGAPRERFAADLSYRMGAAGAVSELLAPGREDGARLALKTDARFTRTSSGAARGSSGGNLAAADGDAWLVRLGLEGSRRFALGEGGTVVPSLELGLRRDGGDAETGFGADLGVGLAVTGGGLTAELSARGLLAHEASGFREWGTSASVGYDPAPSSAEGLTASVRQTWSAASSGVEALLALPTMAGLDGQDGGAFEPQSSLEAEVGYGIAVLGGRGVATPLAGWSRASESETLRLGQSLTLGASQWRVESEFAEQSRSFRASYGYRPADFLKLSVEATRREPANDDETEHALTLRALLRW